MKKQTKETITQTPHTKEDIGGSIQRKNRAQAIKETGKRKLKPDKT